MWATPRTTDGTGGPRKLDEKGRRMSQTNPDLVFGANLADQVRMWPTPRASSAMNASTKSVEKRLNKRGYEAKLEQAVRMWPTPRASEYKDTGPVGSKSWKHMNERDYLSAKAKNPEQPTGKLNSAWVSRLMGYPDGWLEIGSEAYRELRKAKKTGQ
tara:strand:- start:35 stop:505 length:471 start_codon:yes stop_codon:yes gene_type:complete